MINLRYHIVSLTAVFLAIGIGVTLGSTFLDRATVENLNGQLAGLEERLGEREQEVDALRAQLDQAEELQDSLDEQAPALLAGRLDATPVVVVAAEGVDEEDVDGAVRSLEVAGADVQGLWWLQERLLLADDADVADLAAALSETSNDPARLRRMAVAALGDALQDRMLADRAPGDLGVTDVPPDRSTDVPAEDGTPDGSTGGTTEGTTDGSTDVGSEDGTTDGSTGGTTDSPADDVPAPAPASGSLDDLPDVQALIESGYVRFEPVDAGPEEPWLPEGVRVVLVGGSSVLPDDVIVAPLLERMTRNVDVPIGAVVTSTLGAEAEVSELVAAVRDDERLRGLVSTVDDLEHFQGWLATVLAVEDVAEGVVGHYGLGDGASSLLPPLQAP